MWVQINIGNNIMQLSESIKAEANKIAVSSIIARKDKFNSKDEEVNIHLQDVCSANNLPLITRININLHCHINVKDLYWNNYDDKQLIRHFINFIENS